MKKYEEEIEKLKAQEKQQMQVFIPFHGFFIWSTCLNADLMMMIISIIIDSLF